MQDQKYSYLDLTVMPFLRRKVLSGDAAILFDSSFETIMWANASGTSLFGAGVVANLLGEAPSAHGLMGQIRNAAVQIENDQPVVRGFRIVSGLKSFLVRGQISRHHLPGGNACHLLICENPLGNKRAAEHQLAIDTVNSLEGFADAAAIVDDYGLPLASSSRFDDMDVNSEIIRKLVQLTAIEQDRMIKRPIERENGKLVAAGFGRIRDNPGRYIIVLADIDSEAQPGTIEQPEPEHLTPVTHYPSDIPPYEHPRNEELVPPWEVDIPDVGTGEEKNADENPETGSESSLVDRWYFSDENTALPNIRAPQKSGEEQDVVADPFSEAPSISESTAKTAPEGKGEADQSKDIPEATVTPAVAPQTPSQAKEASSGEAPLRFAFTIGPDQIVRSVSAELARIVGPNAASIVGMHWKDISARLGFDESGAIQKLLEKADTWSGKTVLWPVDNTDMVMPVDLAALPAFDRDRKFDGFRGFGIIRAADAIIDPHARGFGLGDYPGDYDENARPAEGTQKTEPVPGLLDDDWPEQDTGKENQIASDIPSSGSVSGKGSDPAFDDENDEKLSLGWKTETASEDEASTAKDIDGTNIENEPRQDNVLPSNIVPIRAHVEKEQQQRDDTGQAEESGDHEDSLNRKEKSAFDDIRRRLEQEALGTEKAQREEDGKDTDSEEETATTEKHAAEETASQKGKPVAFDVSGLPFPVLVYRSDETLFANEHLLKLAGYDSLEELSKAGGIHSLLSRPVGEEETTTLRLKRKQGDSIEVRPTLKRVDWEGAKALCLTFARVGADEASPANALDMVRVSDLENILDTATDGIIILDENGNIEALNASGEALFDKSFEDVKGEPFTNLFANESRSALEDYLDNMKNPGVAGILNDGREVIGIEANGGLIPLFVTLGPIGGVRRYCAVLRDLTQWKKAEEELVHAKRKAENASDQKSEFLARMSHEIREPLNAVIGFSDIMIEERFGPIDNERYREYLRDINRSGIHVLDLVNDLLDISKIEAGKLELSYEAVDLNMLASETVALLQPQANNRRIIIRTSLSRTVPKVVADARSIRQVIMNLVSNAIRYSPTNSQVIVSTTYESNGEVGLRIRDTGKGMNPEELKLALEPFRQIGNTDQQVSGGTGLGLPLTKALVEANRAYFELESTPGEGTIAYIQFPSQRVLAD